MSQMPFTVVGDTETKRGPGRPPKGNHANPETIENYQIDAFYTRASDARGHSHTYRLNVPKDWESLISKVVETHPAYAYSADLIRDAIFHRLAWLIEHRDDPALTKHFQATQNAAEGARRAAQVHEWESHLDEVEKRLGAYKASGYRAGMELELADLDYYATCIPEPFSSQAVVIADTFRRAMVRLASS